jgi:hypothetical protein
VSSKLLRWLERPGRIAWRLASGKSLDGVPRTDATWAAWGTAALDPEKAPRPPERLADEIRSDIAQLREELELRRIARRAEADKSGEGR